MKRAYAAVLTPLMDDPSPAAPKVEIAVPREPTSRYEVTAELKLRVRRRRSSSARRLLAREAVAAIVARTSSSSSQASSSSALPSSSSSSSRAPPPALPSAPVQVVRVDDERARSDV